MKTLILSLLLSLTLLSCVEKYTPPCTPIYELTIQKTEIWRWNASNWSSYPFTNNITISFDTINCTLYDNLCGYDEYLMNLVIDDMNKDRVLQHINSVEFYDYPNRIRTITFIHEIKLISKEKINVQL